jgi:hypothetical protein
METIREGVAQKILNDFMVVARGGIEPPTRGFSVLMPKRVKLLSC